MLDLHDPKQAYEIFRLQWMIDHGYSVLDLLKNLETMIEEDQNEFGVRTGLESYSRTGNSASDSMVPSGPVIRSSWSMIIP